MRNLKRVLSLALALVMMLSLMVVNASAAEVTKVDFTDADEITYTEAVDVMVALEVIEGTDKGAFDPNGVLTREAAAKVICYMLLGPTNAENLTTNTSIFTDVAAGRWSAGYIAYCANLDILAGTGDGSFNPEGQLTGVAFGKMLLVALGYDPAIEQYVGPNWSTAIASDMVDAGIAVNGVVLSEPLTREQAAQMAFQTLTADMVRYASKGTTVNTTDGTTVIVGASEAATITTAGTDGDNYAGDGKDGDDCLQFCEKYFDKLKKDSTDDDFGRPGGIWNYKGSQICFSSDEAVATFTGTFTKKELYNALGNNVVKKVIDGDATDEYHLDGTADQTGVWDADAADFAITSLTGSARTSSDKLGANGMLTEIFVDEDDNVVVVMTNTYLAQVSGEYNTSREELTISLKSAWAGNAPSYTLNLEDFPNLADFDDEDDVLITIADDGSSAEIKSIALAETVTGNVTGYTKNADAGKAKVSVDGTSYNYSATADTALDTTTDYAINEEGNFILDPYGYIIGLGKVEGSKSYVFLKQFTDEGGFSGTYIADAFFADGTHETITLDRVNNNKITAVDPSKTNITASGTYYPGWYTYTTTSTGKYRVVPAANGTPNAANTAVADTTKVTENGKPTINAESVVLGTSNTVFVVKDGNEVKTYTGIRNVPSITATDAATTFAWAALNNNGYATYVFVDRGNATLKGASTSASDLIFILGTGYDTSKDSKDNTYYTFKAIVNGEKKDADASVTSPFSANRGLYTDVTYDADGYVDGGTQVTDGMADYEVKTLTGATITYSGATLKAGANSYVLNDGCIIRLIENNDKVTNLASGSALASKYKGKDVTGTIYVVLDDDGYVTSLYVDVTSVTDTPAACDHSSRTHTDADPATCTTDGNIEYWTCTCGKYWDAATDGNELSAAQLVDGKTGHDFDSAWTADGAKHWHTCKNSGCDVKDSEGAHTGEPSDGSATAGTGDQAGVSHTWTCPTCSKTATGNCNHDSGACPACGATAP